MKLYLWAILVITFFFKISSQCEHGEVRLVGGSGPHEGRVEVCINSQWGRVCSTSWDGNDATVVCRQLGYSSNATINGYIFGQGSGPFILGNIQCNPTRNRELLECCPDYTNTAYCRNDALVRCSDQQRVRNVTAHILNASSTSTVYAVLITWEQNFTVDQPISFEVVCRNEQHSIKITASVRSNNDKSNIKLGGLLLSPDSCCVSAVYQLYEAKEICTRINTNEISSVSTNNQVSNCMNSANVVIEVLGFIIAVLVILLALLGIAFSWLLRLMLRKKTIHGRLASNVEQSLSTQQNTRYSNLAVTSRSTPTSGTTIQVTRANSGDKSTTNYSSLGLTYETIDSCSSDGRNQVLISERYEFADIEHQVENSGGVSTEESVFPGQVIEEEDYAYLQH